MKINISPVVANSLCCGCGTCASICPTNAISITVSEGLFKPEVEVEKCVDCHRCVLSCPSYSMDYKKFNSEIFENQPVNKLLGNFLKCFVGHSMDEQLRFSSTSGGLITQLLIFALESNFIDGALVTRMKSDNPLETESFIARTREEIISASRSKYCPVSANSALKKIMKEDGRFAVVGLPCHLNGVRKAESLDESLNQKIVLHFGLLCSHMVSFLGTEFLLEKLHISKDDVKSLSYRGKGWPGSMSIELKDGNCLDVPLFGDWNAYWPVFSSFFFTPICCTMCPDQAAEFADLAFGDAWLPEFGGEKVGESIILARTKVGEDFLYEASQNNAIFLKSVPCEKVEESQSVNLVIKKSDLATRLYLRRVVGKEVPRHNLNFEGRLSLISFVRALFVYFNIWASSKRFFRSILCRVPFPLFRAYYGLYKYLSII